MCNEVSETVVPTTFVDDAELVWRLADKDMTQTDIGGVLGRGRGVANHYVRLNQLDKEAWQIVIDTTNNEIVSNGENDGVSINDTTVSFSEGLLRQILSLTSSQQFDLVSNLAAKKIDKRQFGKLLPPNPGGFFVQNFKVGSAEILTKTLSLFVSCCALWYNYYRS